MDDVTHKVTTMASVCSRHQSSTAPPPQHNGIMLQHLPACRQLAASTVQQSSVLHCSTTAQAAHATIAALHTTTRLASANADFSLALSLIYHSTVPSAHDVLVPETLLKKRKSDAKAREEKAAKAAESKKVSIPLQRGSSPTTTSQKESRAWEQTRNSTWMQRTKLGQVTKESDGPEDQTQ